MNPKLVVATGNAGKLVEFRELLVGQPVELCSLGDVAELGEVVFPEEGRDYAENAVAKARAVASQLGLPAIADDSGLEVAALGGAPGPLSARYGGAGLDDKGRVSKLIAEVAARPDAIRDARFVCWAALAFPGEAATDACVLGVCEGALLEAPAGDGGFGYDPVFAPRLDAADSDFGRSMAQLADARKNELSHRARALQALVQTVSWAALLAT
jgi:XTP/dITP diphosphohydrolase